MRHAAPLTRPRRQRNLRRVQGLGGLEAVGVRRLDGTAAVTRTKWTGIIDDYSSPIVVRKRPNRLLPFIDPGLVCAGVSAEG